MKKNNLQIYLSIFLLLVLSISINAQWTNVSTNGIDSTCNVTKVFADGSDMYAYISGSGVYKSIDGGNNWNLFNTGLPASIAITAITSDNSKIYVAATLNGIYSSAKSSANFTAIGTVPKLDKAFTALVKLKDTLYLGTAGNGVYKCVIPTAAFTQINTGINVNISSLAIDSLPFLGFRVYAGSNNTDNGFYVKNAGNDTWVQKTITTPLASKVRVRNIISYLGYVVVGTDNNRGILWAGSTTDFSTYTWSRVDTTLLNITTLSLAFDGSALWIGNGRGAWKSSPIATPPVKFTQVANGLQSARANVSDLATNGVNVIAAQATGGYITSNGGASWSNKLNIPVTPASINGIKYYNGVLHAFASSGIYTSASGNGGDWVKLGNGINSSVGLASFCIGSLGTYATTDGTLFKLNGANWEVVNIDIPGSNALDHPISCQISDIGQYNNGVKTYLFGSGWSSGAIYRYDGTTWDTYTTITTTENSTGVVQNNATDTTQRLIARDFLYDSIANILFSFHKNRIQISKDMGNTWTYRLGNYLLNTVSSNIRAVMLHEINAVKYLYIGTDATAGGLWTMARSKYSPDPNDSIARLWENNSLVGETRGIVDFGKIIFIRETTTSGVTTALKISTNNGASSSVFETSLLNKANVKSLSRSGNFTWISTSNNTIQKYDLTTAPVFMGTTPFVDGITETTASLKATSSRPGKLFYVVVAYGATAPSIDQIIAGKDAADATPIAAASVVITDSVQASGAIAGLSANTQYTLYTVAESEVILTSSFVAIDFTTLTTNNKVATAPSVIAVYPSPTTGILNIQGSGIKSVKVSSILGSVVLEQSLAGNSTINISSLANGVYFVEVTTASGKEVKRIIKK